MLDPNPLSALCWSLIDRRGWAVTAPVSARERKRRMREVILVILWVAIHGGMNHRRPLAFGTREIEAVEQGYAAPGPAGVAGLKTAQRCPDLSAGAFSPRLIFPLSPSRGAPTLFSLLLVWQPLTPLSPRVAPVRGATNALCCTDISCF